MASYGHRQTAPQAGHRHGSPAMAAPGVAAPPGTFSPGTKIQVGSHLVVIQKYLSEGGFAHVYLVKMPKPVDGTDLGVLKRVAVPDKEALRSMRTEVETMKRLKGHRPIVTYIDSHASEMRGGGYEVFLLMEYCNGGGLIDFMNTRLQHRLTEPEILNIFVDIAEGVACMHYLKPALLHRDLKVENVLITSRGSAKRFKLCDFGSAAAPRPAPTTVVECRLMDEDVQRHTTLQYRSPEMIDVYRKQPLNEKSDIWALGVLLYKLCYYTTPFEDQGQLAILNASYRYPSHPVFSNRIKKLIASMLKESIEARPNIYQVLKEACAMQGREVPVKDIYAGRSHTESRPNDKASAERKAKPVVGAVVSAPVEEKPRIPDVVPMRRGRPSPLPGPTKASEVPGSPAKPIAEGDPFAALDSKNGVSVDGDELSSRFPTLDQFSLLHDQGAKFDFDSAIASPPPEAPAVNPIPRVAAKLADAAFASPETSSADPILSPGKRAVPSAGPEPAVAPSLAMPTSAASSAQPKTEGGKAQSIISRNPDLKVISSQANLKYVSTGTMTAEITPEPLATRAVQGTGQSRPGGGKHPSLQPRSGYGRRPSLSSRPSLEDNRAIASADAIERTGSLPSRPRPASTAFESSTLEFLREKESSTAHGRPARPLSRGSQPRSSSSLNATARDDSIQISNVVDRLIDMDDSDSDTSPRLNVAKRSVVSQASGSRNKLAGKFGDAFKRFEGTAAPEIPATAATPPPLKGVAHHELTPIAGSEATDGRSDDGLTDLNSDNATPEMRREIERRQLQEEEERVAAAQAEYRKRLTSEGASQRPVPGPKKVGIVPKSANIQSRVRSLLEEEQRPSQVQRTAEGYGKYSDAATAASKPENDKALPSIPRKPPAAPRSRAEPTASPAERPTGSRPAAPKKPVHLNSLPTGARPPSPAKRSQPTETERLIAAELPGQPLLEMSAQEKDDYIKDFTKRFPSLSSMELEAAMSRGGGAVGQ
ncbi:kinase [Hirsutella rhossiliensis]|uniref:non-specific serine/threonine protein kinase n=1 Tax=Hirsutella rhossiliensis TaxID=111463 RepID=A0A9P8SI53_9HYPO|nr:kinase [Hirsutella rhossiliensis]KAH0963526.1 kinase [Hirsutella rhossiliensis]